MSLFKNLFGKNEDNENHVHNEVEGRYDNPLEILDKGICEDPSYDVAYNEYQNFVENIGLYDPFDPSSRGASRAEIEKVLTSYFDVIQRELFEDDYLVEYKYGPYDDPSLGKAYKATIAVNYIDGYASVVTYSPGKFDLNADKHLAADVADRVMQPHKILDFNARALTSGWARYNGEFVNLYMVPGDNVDGGLSAHYYLFINNVAKYYMITPLPEAVVDMPMTALVVLRNYSDTLE